MKTSEDVNLGGAANVARQMATYMDTIFAFKQTSCSDSSFDLMHQIFAEYKIMPEPLKMNKRGSATVKKRIWIGGQQICRIDEEEITKPNKQMEFEWFNQLSKIIHDEDISVVILSDYDKGTLTDVLVMRICSLCKELGIPTVFDPKRPTFHSCYDATIVKPNEKEVKSTGLKPKSCSRKLKNSYLVNTLGAGGMRIWQNAKEICHVPSNPCHVYDVNGCGDTVTALLAIGLYEGMGIEDNVQFATNGAAVTLGHTGTYSLSLEEINGCRK